MSPAQIITGYEALSRVSVVSTVFAVLSRAGVSSRRAGGVDHLDSLTFEPVAAVHLDRLLR